jgi:hypothetical protein
MALVLAMPSQWHEGQPSSRGMMTVLIVSPGSGGWGLVFGCLDGWGLHCSREAGAIWIGIGRGSHGVPAA